MSETVYVKGVPGEMPDIIDFINYVFSQTKVPHDFKKLLPKVYGDGAPRGQESFHFLARQNEKIVGCVACRSTALRFGSEVLSCGYVGSVSVHKYHRGEGHMKKLMAMMLEDARKKNYDMLILGGQRQRYGYFGFEPAGMVLRFDFTKTNAHHVFGDVDTSGIGLRPLTDADVPFALKLWQKQTLGSLREAYTFMDELRSWDQTPLGITVNGELTGYFAGGEMVLQDENLLPKALKAIMDSRSEYALPLVAGLHEKQRIAYLSSICESAALGRKAMINVLNWPRILKTLIEFKHSYVSPVNDCAFALDIVGDGVFDVKIRDGRAEVKPLAATPETAVKLGHNEAQRLFFGIAEQFLGKPGIDSSCLGLPFFMSEQDAF